MHTAILCGGLGILCGGLGRGGIIGRVMVGSGTPSGRAGVAPRSPRGGCSTGGNLRLGVLGHSRAATKTSMTRLERRATARSFSQRDRHVLRRVPFRRRAAPARLQPPSRISCVVLRSPPLHRQRQAASFVMGLPIGLVPQTPGSEPSIQGMSHVNRLGKSDKWSCKMLRRKSRAFRYCRTPRRLPHLRVEHARSELDRAVPLPQIAQLRSRRGRLRSKRPKIDELPCIEGRAHSHVWQRAWPILRGSCRAWPGMPGMSTSWTGLRNKYGSRRVRARRSRDPIHTSSKRLNADIAALLEQDLRQPRGRDLIPFRRIMTDPYSRCSTARGYSSATSPTSTSVASAT